MVGRLSNPFRPLRGQLPQWGRQNRKASLINIQGKWQRKALTGGVAFQLPHPRLRSGAPLTEGPLGSASLSGFSFGRGYGARCLRENAELAAQRLEGFGNPVSILPGALHKGISAQRRRSARGKREKCRKKLVFSLDSVYTSYAKTLSQIAMQRI